MIRCDAVVSYSFLPNLTGNVCLLGCSLVLVELFDSLDKTTWGRALEWSEGYGSRIKRSPLGGLGMVGAFVQRDFLCHQTTGSGCVFGT